MGKVAWHLLREGKRYGPITDGEIIALVEQGHLRGDDLLWKPGFSDWKRADEIPGLLAPPETPSIEPTPSDRADLTENLDSVIHPLSELKGDRSHGHEPFVHKHIVDPDGAGQNYFTKHWRGEYSLGISYWINNVLITLIFITITAIITANFRNSYDIGIIVTTFILIVVVMTAMALWQMVGLWRSAENHKTRTKRKFWATLAQLAVIVGMLGLAKETVNNIKLAYELTTIVAGTSPSERTEFEVLQNGKELVVTGGISFGIVDEIEKQIEAHPEIHILRLDSYGGRIGPARRLRDLVDKKQLVTYTAKGCYSACTIPFLAGKQRVLKRGAKLGFHQLAMMGVNREELQAEEKKDRRYFSSKGVPKWFLTKAFSTPSTEMWHPTTQELLRAGFVTKITDGNDFGIQYDSKNAPYDIEKTLLEFDYVRKIKQYNASLYKLIVADITESIKNGMSLKETLSKMNAHIADVVLKNISFADGDIIIKYTKLIVYQIRTLNKKDPKLCYKFIFSKKYGEIDVLDHFSIDRIKEEQNLIGEVLESASVNPITKWNEIQAQSDIKVTIDALSRVYTAKDIGMMVKPPKYGSRDMGKYCSIMSDMYDTILALPKERSVNLLRSIYSSIDKNEMSQGN